MGKESISFGPFVLDRSNGVLLIDGKATAVGQRALALLTALAEAEGPVDKSALMEAAWPGTIVEENNLTVQIAALRKALGPRDDGSEWIVTVPRVGYRLIRGSHGAVVADEQASPLPSLAVLPFENLSGDPEQAYFADGVVEDLTTALSSFRSFVTIARNSSFVYKGRAVDVRQVAKELNVQYVLEGSVRRSGGRLRVTAQLIDGSTGGHLWAKTYDGVVEDVFDMQDRITAQVAGTVSPMIEDAEIERSRSKRTDQLDAYELRLRGLVKQYSRHMSENAEAFSLLKRAIDLDPHFAPALSDAALLIDARVAMGWPPLTADDRAEAVDLARRALREAGGDARTLGTAAVVLMQSGRAYQEALDLVNAAIARNPNNLMTMLSAGVVHCHCGDLRRTIALSERFLDLSPVDAGRHWAMTGMAHAYMALGEFEEAIGWAEKSRTVNDEFQPTYWMLVAGNAKLGRLDEARRWLRQLLALYPEASVAKLREGQPNRYPDRMANIFEGLLLAGLPETGPA